MKNEIYQLSVPKVFLHSSIICLFMLFYFWGMWMVIPRAIQEGNPVAPIAVTLFCGIIILPGLLLVRNYWRHSLNLKLVVTNDSLDLVNKKTGENIKILNSEIKSIVVYSNNRYIRIPWPQFEFFSIEDYSNKKITIPSYIMPFSELWNVFLSKQLDSSKLTQKNTVYPIIRA